VFGESGIDSLIDPFPQGCDIDKRIETLNVHALLFLSDPESLKSEYCLKELNAARRRSIPIFAAQIEGPIPEEFRRRIYISLDGRKVQDCTGELAEFASALRSRGQLYQKIKHLTQDQFPEDSRSLAKSISDEPEVTVLAEFVKELKLRFREMKSDPTTQYWLACAIGKVGTPEAKRILARLLQEKDIHPYAQEGLKDAIRAVSDLMSKGGTQ